MPQLDASSAIWAWDNYPIAQFPPVWNWLSGEIQARRIQISYPALDEVGHIDADCKRWLVEAGIDVKPIDQAIIDQALTIKGLIGVEQDNFHPDGVDENDILIISTARCCLERLISDELQPTPPQNTRRYKVPTVCRLQPVSVDCGTFLDFIKSTRVVFG